MRDLQSIIEVNRADAERAADEDQVPFVLTSEDLDAARCGALDNINIPTLGDYLPDGWRRVDLRDWYSPNCGEGTTFMHGVDFNLNAFFVDHSGVGGRGEPALTLVEFFDLARPGFGYASVETGPFQTYVGVFQRVREPASETFGAGTSRDG